MITVTGAQAVPAQSKGKWWLQWDNLHWNLCSSPTELLNSCRSTGVYVCKKSLTSTMLFISLFLHLCNHCLTPRVWCRRDFNSVTFCTNAEQCHPKQGRSEKTNKGMLESKMALVSMKCQAFHEPNHQFFFKAPQ